ncbi:Signal-induced proliferation-associated 1-like protein 1 [Plecturocebus cupreus]
MGPAAPYQKGTTQSRTLRTEKRRAGQKSRAGDLRGSLAGNLPVRGHQIFVCNCGVHSLSAPSPRATILSCCYVAILDLSPPGDEVFLFLSFPLADARSPQSQTFPGSLRPLWNSQSSALPIAVFLVGMGPAEPVPVRPAHSAPGSAALSAGKRAAPAKRVAPATRVASPPGISRSVGNKNSSESWYYQPLCKYLMLELTEHLLGTSEFYLDVTVTSIETSACNSKKLDMGRFLFLQLRHLHLQPPFLLAYRHQHHIGLSPGSDIYVTVSSMALARSQCRNSPSNLSSSSDTGSVGGTYRQKSMPEGFGVSRRSPASIDRQNTQSDISGSGKSLPSWQRSEDSIADQMVSKVLPAFRESPSGRLMRQDPVVHLSPNKQGHLQPPGLKQSSHLSLHMTGTAGGRRYTWLLFSDSHYSSHSSSNTLSSNASSAHSDEKWYDGDRTESELNSYNYLQGTSADSGIDTTSYGPSHGSTASLGAATSSPRSGPGKEKVPPLWHSSSEVISMADRTLETESHGLDRKTESSLSLDIHSKSQAGSSPLTRENSTFSINDAASHTRVLASAGGCASLCGNQGPPQLGLTLTLRLECSGGTTAHCSRDLLNSSNPPTSAFRVAGTAGMRHLAQLIFNLFVETGSHHVAQASLILLGSGNFLTLASQSAEIIGMSH